MFYDCYSLSTLSGEAMKSNLCLTFHISTKIKIFTFIVLRFSVRVVTWVVTWQDNFFVRLLLSKLAHRPRKSNLFLSLFSKQLFLLYKDKFNFRWEKNVGKNCLNLFWLLVLSIKYSNTRPKRFSIDNTNKNRRLLGAGGSQWTTVVQAEPITIAYWCRIFVN